MMKHARSLGLLASLSSLVALGCAAADDTTYVAPAPADTGVRRDTGSVIDASTPFDRASPPDLPVAPDTGTPTPMVAPPPPPPPPPPPMDAGPPDTGVIDTGVVTLGDAFQAPRDVTDTAPRDVDLTVSGAPTSAPMRFGGTEDAARAPTIVYPSPGTIVPPNLQGFEVHFRPGAGNDLFEVSFRGDRGLLRVFTTCARVADGCVLTLDARAYDELARVAQPSGNVTLAVRGTTTASGASVGRSASQPLGVTNTDVRGGLYYWSSSGSIYRYEFGRAGARPELFLPGNPIACVGCHTISRDGSRMAAGRGIPGPAQTQVIDVASRNAVSGNFGSNFGAFSPDNTRFLSSNGTALTLLETARWTNAPGLGPNSAGSMPDWSRNGRFAVYARIQGLAIPLFGQPGHNGPGDLVRTDWSGTAFGAPTVLVRATGSQNNYYPGIAPDDTWVIFNRSGMTSYNAIDAHLWAVRADNPASAVRLAAADGAGDLGNSWPKWAAFVQSYQGEPLLWFTFSSRRDYGLRLQQQSRAAEMRTVQLWMAAFRPNRAGTGDPSAPAFWLPFQDVASGNHIAQWSEQVQRQGCRADTDCRAGERCVMGGVTSMSGTLSCVMQ
jgi:TolB protein